MSKKYEHEHIICTAADEDIYRRQCATLEKHIPGLVKLKELQDVDSSLVQLYTYGDKEIVVLNDCYRDTPPYIGRLSARSRASRAFR